MNRSFSYALVGGVALTAVALAQQVDPLEDPAGYARLPAADKQALLWERVTGSAHTHTTIPPWAVSGPLSLNLLHSKESALLPLLRIGFETRGDVRQARHKIFHTHGSTAQVELVIGMLPGEAESAAAAARGISAALGGAPAVTGSVGAGSSPAAAGPYTGVLASGARGLLRLSLGAGERDLVYMPGMGLKLFVDGQPSLDTLGLVSFAPVPKEQAELLHPANALTNSLPPISGKLAPALELAKRYFSRIAKDPLHRPIDHFGRWTKDGAAVAQPRAPHALVFRPADEARAAMAAALKSNVVRGVVNATDLRVVLLALPVGKPLYWVYAKEQGSSRETCLGALVLRSGFVSSDFGDLMLNFEHTGETVSPTRLEQLEQLPSEVVRKLDQLPNVADLHRRWGSLRDRIRNRLDRPFDW